MTATRQDDQTPPHTVGELLQFTFQLFFRHFRRWMLLTICIYIPFLILEALLNVNTSSLTSQLLTHTATPAQIREIIASSLPTLAWSSVLSIISGLVIVPLLYGSTLDGVVQVSQEPVQNSHPQTWNAFVRTFRRWPVVVGTVVMRGVVYFLAFVICVAVVALVVMLFQLVGFNSAAVGTAAVILSVTAMWVLIWLAMKLAFIPSVTFQEGLSYTGALRRSFDMTQGKVWKMVGFFLLVELIVFVTSLVFGSVAQAVHNSFAVTILTDVGAVLVTPFQIVGMAVLYLNIRQNKLDR